MHELEIAAMDPRGVVLEAMRDLAPWAGRTLLDLGCGSGFWLPGYTAEAAEVVGVEPDPTLLPLAAARPGGARVLHGSAEHLPLPDTSVDVVHRRFAYFFPPGCDAGLAEVRRVLRPGGRLVVDDDDHHAGEFAQLLARSAWAAYQGCGDATARWWAECGAVRREVMSEWRSTRPSTLAKRAAMGRSGGLGVAGNIALCSGDARTFDCRWWPLASSA